MPLMFYAAMWVMRTAMRFMPLLEKPHNGKCTYANSNFANALYGNESYANSNKIHAATAIMQMRTATCTMLI